MNQTGINASVDQNPTPAKYHVDSVQAPKLINTMLLEVAEQLTHSNWKLLGKDNVERVKNSRTEHQHVTQNVCTFSSVISKV